VLTDNGAIFNGGPRKGTTAFEALLSELGIVMKHSRPYHPAVSRGPRNFSVSP
jgi:transposase InsO family protein